jgi:hypothetical protein
MRFQDDLPGCALSRSICEFDLDECLAESCLIETTSFSTGSSVKVASVLVGDTGECGVFSSVNVSPVSARGGAIEGCAHTHKRQCRLDQEIVKFNVAMKN